VPFVTTEKVTIKAGQHLARGVILQRSEENNYNISVVSSLTQGKEFDNPKDITRLIKETVRKSECPEQHQKELEQLLMEHRDVLAKKGDPLGLCDYYVPSLPLDTDEPIYQPQYPVPHHMRGPMKEAIEEFLKEGIIEHSKSPYNAPTMMVKKKDYGHRMVIDLRLFNKHLITDPYPLPRISQILEDIGSSKYFSALDLLHGFYNLRINPKDVEKTGFSTYEGHYHFLRLPMGLKNSPATFQRLMNIVLAGALGVFAYIYIDDIVIFSKNIKDHLKHLKIILQKLRDANIKIKFSKSQICMTKIEYLGFIITTDGLMVNPPKVQAVENFPVPTCVKAVQAFLGLVGYFRIFIYDFAGKAKPLYQLLKKNNKFFWGPEQQLSFEKLKQALMTAPVLAFPDFKKEFILTTDASQDAIGAILTQVQDGAEKLISCYSKTLVASERNYSNTDREIFAVVQGVKHHRSYLWGSTFVIRTDHSAIPYLVNNPRGDWQSQSYKMAFTNVRI